MTTPPTRRKFHHTWRRTDDLPLSRLVVLFLTLQWAGLSLFGFFEKDTGFRHPLSWIWLVITILLVATFMWLALIRVRDRFILGTWIPAAAGMLVIEIANGGGAAGRGMILGLCGGILMAHWIANSLLAH